MNRIVKISAACVAVVWIFCMGLIIGSYRVRSSVKNELDPQTTTQASSSSTSQVSTSEIVISMVTNQTTLPEKKDDPLGLETTKSDGSISTFASKDNTTAETPQSALPSGNAEIAKALVNAINATKATQNFSLKKTEKLSVTVDEATGGTESVVNSLVAKQLDRPDTVCTFSNGVDTEGTGKTPNSVIAPLNKMASLDESAIQSATVTAGVNGSYTIELVLKPETQTLSQKASNHDGVFETIDVSSLGLPDQLKINELYINYSSASIKADINKLGKLNSITYVLPVTDGGGSGSMVIPVNVKMHGQYDCTVICTY